MHIQTYNHYKFQEGNCKACKLSGGQCAAGDTGADEQEQVAGSVPSGCVPAWGHRNPTLTGFSPVLGVEPLWAVGGHGVGAGLVSVELKPSRCPS